jgi:hypothetical protein
MSLSADKTAALPHSGRVPSEAGRTANEIATLQEVSRSTKAAEQSGGSSPSRR